MHGCGNYFLQRISKCSTDLGTYFDAWWISKVWKRGQLGCNCWSATWIIEVSWGLNPSSLFAGHVSGQFTNPRWVSFVPPLVEDITGGNVLCVFGMQRSQPSYCSHHCVFMTVPAPPLLRCKCCASWFSFASFLLYLLCSDVVVFLERLSPKI